MLKFVIIGFLITAVLSFILWNVWNMVLVKHKKFSDSELYFSSLKNYKGSSLKLETLRKDKVKNWAVAGVVTFIIVVLAVTYFLVARNNFLSSHTHSYTDRVITEASCVSEGLLHQKCRYCNEGYEEVIPVIEHKYSKSDHIKSTCAKKGVTEYTCKVCGDIKKETLPLKEHKYTEKVKREPTCTKEGILEKQCKKCDYVEKEKIPVNDSHNFKVYSFTHSTFWKNGYNHYSCKACGGETYSLKVEKINWIVVLAILVLIISIVIIAAVYIDEGFWSDVINRPSAWIAAVFAVLSISVIVFHYGFAIPHQKNCEPLGQKLTKAPVGCELVVKKGDKSAYMEKGSISYKCKKCDKVYTEYLLLNQKCTDHTKTTEHYLKKPKCMKSVNLITVCDKCSTITSVKKIEKFEHNWSKWKTVKSDSSWLLKEKTRSCKLCREKQTVEVFAILLVIMMVVINILWMILCVGAVYDQTRKYALYALATVLLSLVEAFFAVKAPVFSVFMWSEVALGFVLAANLIMIVQLICYCGDYGSYYSYKFSSFALAIIFALTVALRFTFFTDYNIACVIIMAALAINALVQAFKANSTRKDLWTFLNILVALINTGFAIFLLLKK